MLLGYVFVFFGNRDVVLNSFRDSWMIFFLGHRGQRSYWLSSLYMYSSSSYCEIIGMPGKYSSVVLRPFGGVCLMSLMGSVIIILSCVLLVCHFYALAITVYSTFKL